MSTIDEFDNKLPADLKMLNIIDSIFKYKRDMKLINDIQNQRLKKLEQLKDPKDPNHPKYPKQELRKLRELLLKSATEDFLEKIDKDFEKLDVIESYYKTDIKSILKDFKNLDLKKFHENEMSKAKKTHEMKINKLLYMYISNYILSREDTSDLFSLINTYLSADSVKTTIKELLKKKELEKQNLEKQNLEIVISMFEIFQTLEKHILYVYTEFYKLYKIEVNENKILLNVSRCLSNINSILFITTKKENNGDFVYTTLCVTKKEFLEFITNKEKIKHSCNYDDPITYISMPIGPPQNNTLGTQTKAQINSDVYIPYLSAIMICKQNTKSIFYLLRKKDTPDITNVNSYCDIKDNIPIMYIATCAGDNCDKKD